MTEAGKPNPDVRDTVPHNSDRERGSTGKDARAVRSGVALRDALLRLLGRKPFEQITVRDICAEAGVHYATFFRHYASKEALLDTLAADQIATSVELTLPIRDAGDERGSLHALCAYIDEHRALWSVLLNGGAGATMRAEWLRAARIVAESREPVGSWLPKELGTICSTSLIVETVAWWLAQPDHDVRHDPRLITGFWRMRVGEAANQRWQLRVITDCSAKPSASEMRVKSSRVSLR
jgi:AcrR family transcriptional regulator